MLDRDCKAFLDHLSDTNLKDLNAKILMCLFWKLSEAFITITPEDVSMVGDTRVFFILLFIYLLFSLISLVEKCLHHS